MSKAHTKLFFHLTWATWRRHPFVVEDVQERLYRYVVRKCEEYGYQLFAVNGMEDHLHIVIRLQPYVSVSEAVRKLKGSTSHFCNRQLGLETIFRWQQGYGALTFGKQDLKKVVAYVQRQKQHHRKDEIDLAIESIDLE